mmetsp:Transcript_61073/g.157494  ORF Transcript_61073/g.157494 Transcript_61073/m.157494 type:complete len:248 (-) Transcript_61073:3098-3841(-)
MDFLFSTAIDSSLRVATASRRVCLWKGPSSFAAAIRTARRFPSTHITCLFMWALAISMIASRAHFLASQLLSPSSAAPPTRAVCTAGSCHMERLISSASAPFLARFLSAQTPSSRGSAFSAKSVNRLAAWSTAALGLWYAPNQNSVLTDSASHRFLSPLSPNTRRSSAWSVAGSRSSACVTSLFSGTEVAGSPVLPRQMHIGRLGQPYVIWSGRSSSAPARLASVDSAFDFTAASNLSTSCCDCDSP